MIKYFLLALLLTTGLVHCQDDDNEDISVDESPAAAVDSEQAATEAGPKPYYVTPVVLGPFNFLDTFDIDSIGAKWIRSLAKKLDVAEDIAKYDGQWAIESAIETLLEGDKGLVLKSKAKHHAISARLERPFDFTLGKPLVVQYEVKFQTAMECGGAYVKLLTNTADLKLDQFFDKTPFTIMFGPDKCGGDAKLHFILRHKHPLTGAFEEKHAKKTENIDMYFNDGRTHLFTLIVRPNQRYSMLIDQLEVNTGSLLTDLQPPIVPPKEILDPNDKKPDSWDEREKIPDPDARKPDDWNESEPKEIVDEFVQKPADWLDDEEPTVADPSAVKPDDWDVETDGEWEAPRVDNPKCADGKCGKWSAPMIPNPKYKGKWKAPLITNPAYQGKWQARTIPNPDYFEESDPFSRITPIGAVGLELWSMTENVLFDNFIIADNENVVNELAKDTWALKRDVEIKTKSSSSSAQSVLDAIIEPTKDKPWLWAVYLLVVLIPIALIVLFCCGSSDAKRSVDAKKTDAPTPDDNVQQQPAASQAEQEEATNEQQQQDDEDSDEKTEDVENKTSSLKASTNSLNKNDENDDNDESEQTKTQRTSPRNRRPRKE